MQWRRAAAGRAALAAALVATAACGAGPGGGRSAGGDPVRLTAGRVWPPDRPGYVNPIPGENARRGEPTWNTGRAATQREVELYADRISARPGDTVAVMASSDTAHRASWALYRIGWYEGDGARRVDQGGPVNLSRQGACAPTADTGLVRCAWTPSFEIRIAPDAIAGLYAIRVSRDDQLFSMAPIVVVDDRPADLLLQASVTTWQAYNAWAGESLYADGTGRLPGGAALQVSFDRPYGSGGGLGLMLADDVRVARFLERHGYDVTYGTNARASARGAAELLRAGAFLSSTHDEYWTGEERDAAEAALAAGQPLLFLGANPAYWKIRLEAWDGPENPRVMTCYKLRADPVQGAAVTGRFRDALVGRPEDALVGAMYEGWMDLAQRWVVHDAASWLLAGTGLAAGDTVPYLVGYEYDRTFDDGLSPPGLEVLGRSPVVNAEGRPSIQETVAWRASSGALVFGAGTSLWTGALLGAGERADARVERMTANVLHEALGLPVPGSVGQTPPPPAAAPRGPFAASVITVATGLDRPTALAVTPDGSLAVLEAGRNRVIRVTARGEVSPIAGDGRADPYRDGPGATARFSTPAGILALSDGTLLVADSNHHTIRRIAADAARTVTTVAGGPGRQDFADGVGGAARFGFPMGLVEDPVTGRILIADSANDRIRALDLRTGAVTTLAGGSGGPVDLDGPAASARFLRPTALAAAPRPDRRVFVVATGGCRIKVLQPDAGRTMLTLAGSYDGFADGSGPEARLAPQGGAAWAGGEVVFSDPGSLRLRALAPGVSAAGSTVHTVAGSGRSAAEDGPGAAASFTLPLGVAVAPDGTLYVADAGSGTIRAVRR